MERQYLFGRNGYGVRRFTCFYIFITVSETHGSWSTLRTRSRGRDGDFPNAHIRKKIPDARRVRSGNNSCLKEDVEDPFS